MRRLPPREALPCAEVALETNPRDPVALRVKADVALREGKAEEATGILEQALAVDAHNAALWGLKGAALQAMGKNAESLEALSHAVSLDPRDGKAWRAKGLAHVKRSEFAEAADAYERALRVTPDDKELWTLRAFALERSLDLEPAVAAYDKAIAIDPVDKAVWSGKGLTLLRLERYEDAARCFEYALKLDAAYDVAVQGKRDAEAGAQHRFVQENAGRVVAWERANGRTAGREEAFRMCGVPLAVLDEVMGYLNEPAAVAYGTLPEEKRRRYEALSSVVLRMVDTPQAVDRHHVATCDPDADVSEVREVWGYIRGVAAADMETEPDAELDALLRRALDLPREEWDVVHLARELNLGIYEAKRLETSLRIFEGGAYPVTMKPAPEIAKPRAHAPPPPPKKAEEVREAHRCKDHQGKAVSKHSCGAWLCSACLDEENCPSCGKALHTPQSPAPEIREHHKNKPEAEGAEGDEETPPPPKDEGAETPAPRPPRKREDDPQRDFSRL